jgi:hypothetical protein
MVARRECGSTHPPSAVGQTEQVFGILMFGFGRTDVCLSIPRFCLVVERMFE